MKGHESLTFEHERGRPQSWETLDDDLRARIEKSVDQVADELEVAGFVGAYLHGSLASGSFYRPKSDVDILFVVEQHMPPDQRERVAKTLCDLSDDLPLTGDFEVSVVRHDDTMHFQHPLPFELHYGDSHKEAIRRGDVDFEKPRTDPDLAVHCTAVRARGVRLSGEPIEDVFGPVPVENYRDSILGDLEWILEDEHLLESPFYGVLNCCRVLELQAEGWDKVISKDEGGDWALRHLPDDYRPIVSQALACYRSPEPVSATERQTHGHPWDAAALRELREYVRMRSREAALRSVDVRESPIHGKGVFANRNFAEGELVLPIDDSRVVDAAHPLNPSADEHEHHQDWLGDRSVLMQEPERYINHACEPNTYVHTIGGTRWVKAYHPIGAGDEITYDYTVNSYGDHTWEDNCGSPKCRHVQPADFFKLPDDKLREYLPLLDSWFVEWKKDEVASLRRRLR